MPELTADDLARLRPLCGAGSPAWSHLIPDLLDTIAARDAEVVRLRGVLRYLLDSEGVPDEDKAVIEVGLAREVQRG